MKNPSRLKFINGALRQYLASIPRKKLSPAARAVVRCIADATEANGRCWDYLAAIADATGYEAGAVSRAIAEASKFPELLLYVRPDDSDLLPWTGPKNSHGKVTQPKPRAWGFWVPKAACGASEELAREACARSVWEHVRAAGERWPVEGEGFHVLLDLGQRLADAPPAPSNTTEAKPQETARPPLTVPAPHRREPDDLDGPELAELHADLERKRARAAERAIAAAASIAGGEAVNDLRQRFTAASGRR